MNGKKDRLALCSDSGLKVLANVYQGNTLTMWDQTERPNIFENVHFHILYWRKAEVLPCFSQVWSTATVEGHKLKLFYSKESFTSEVHRPAGYPILSLTHRQFFSFLQSSFVPLFARSQFQGFSATEISGGECE